MKGSLKVKMLQIFSLIRSDYTLDFTKSGQIGESGKAKRSLNISHLVFTRTFPFLVEKVSKSTAKPNPHQSHCWHCNIHKTKPINDKPHLLSKDDEGENKSQHTVLYENSTSLGLISPNRLTPLGFPTLSPSLLTDSVRGCNTSFGIPPTPTLSCYQCWTHSSAFRVSFVFIMFH